MIYAYTGIIALTLAIYAFYQRTWHPLAGYPGPFWASLTDFYNVLEWISGQHPYRLTALHEKYGPVVRYGPNRLSFMSSDVINTIFVRGFKTHTKTEFYDTFGNARMPHLFIHRDPVVHAEHRRLLLKSFSPQAVEKYEPLVDACLLGFRERLREHSAKGTVCDLRHTIYLFMCDCIATLMYGEDFGIQATGEKQRLPDDHTLSKSNAVLGSWASMHLFAPLLAVLPHPQTGLWRMRNTLSYVFEYLDCIRRRKGEMDKGVDLDRGDVLSSVLTSIRKSSESVEWTDMHVCCEMMGFVFAGIHPAAATMAMLFWNFLHNPETLAKASAEVEQQLPSMTPDHRPYSLAEVEQHLPYLRSCIKENFRITPAFTMPLARYVMDDETFLNGGHIPRGTSVALCNHAFHHNPSIWGPDHDIFDPDRWQRDSSQELSKLLMHFGAGGRQCIGKALATSVIYKLVSTAIAEFSFELADAEEQKVAMKGGFQGRLPELESVSISDLRGPLNVRVKAKAA